MDFSRLRTRIRLFLSIVLLLLLAGLGPSCLALASEQTPCPTSAPTAPQSQFAFAPTSSLPAATIAHASVTLADGRVLVTGGMGKLFGTIPVAANLMRVYDPKDHCWQSLPVHLCVGRLQHEMIRLGDGRILIVGGLGQDRSAVRSIEMFDPDRGAIEVVGKLQKGRPWPRLTLLDDTHVLITGDQTYAEVVHVPAERSGPVTVEKLQARMSFRHSCHAVVSLPDGTVLFATGKTSGISRFDPESNQFEKCQTRLPLILDDQSAALLYDGRVLLVGGQNILTGKCIDQTWLYDPQADELTAGPALAPYDADGVPQPGAADVIAVDLFYDVPERRGRFVFLAGGEYDPGDRSKGDVILSSAWVFDAEQAQLIEVGPMCWPHDDFRAEPLPPENGYRRVLLIGGHGRDDSFDNHCEIFYWRQAP